MKVNESRSDDPPTHIENGNGIILFQRMLEGIAHFHDFSILDQDISSSIHMARVNDGSTLNADGWEFRLIRRYVVHNSRFR
jgi:hypothetical protein